MKHNWSKKQIDEIIAKYKQNISCTQIAKEYNVSTVTICKLLKDNNIQIENKQNQLKFNLQDLKKDYMSGLSIAKLAKNYKTTYRTIKKYFDKENIKIINTQNRLRFNENIFDVIDTEEKAYWLGFIFADGNISSSTKTKSKYSFELSLKEEDLNHLQKFNKFMEHENNNIKQRKVTINNKIYISYRWLVTNKHLWKTLNNLGCVPKKSLVLQFPNVNVFSNKSLIRHFIRGYFDGDGSLGYYKNGPHFSVLGTKDIIEQLNKNTFNLPNKISTNNNVFCLQSSGSRALAFCYIIYYKSNIYLDRKYQKFLQIKDCRFKAKALKLLEGKIGEGWDANPELIADLNDLQQCNA